MLDPNSTIFVQMIHFLVACIVLRVFLWRPVIVIIQQEEEQKRTLENEYQKQRALIEHKEQELKQVWFHAREAFLVTIPQSTDRRFDKLIALKKFTVHTPQVSEQQMQVLVDTITKKVCE